MKAPEILRIALDIDDVLAGFVPAVFELNKNLILTPHENYWDEDSPTVRAMEAVGGNLEDKDCKVFDENFWLNLNPLMLPVKLRHIEDFVYAYVTSSPRRYIHVRRRWLQENGFPPRPVFHATDKVALMKELGLNLLVDDNPKHVNAAEDAGFTGVLFKPWYSAIEHGSAITDFNQPAPNPLLDKVVKFQKEVEKFQLAQQNQQRAKQSLRIT